MSPPARAKQLVWIHGEAIDVSGFEKWHPGGDVIKQFLGRDATTVFVATHPVHVQKTWVKPRTVPVDQAGPHPPCQAALRDDYLKLHAHFTQQGWFKPTLAPLFKNLASSAFFFGLALWAPIALDAEGRMFPPLLGFLVGMGMHQLAFTVHDTLHGAILNKHSSWTKRLIRLLADAGFGVIGAHWDDEHTSHHVMSNCVDHDAQQRNAPVITVDWKQWTLKGDAIAGFADLRIGQWLLRVNHWLWAFLALWAGRPAIQIVGLIWAKQQWRDGRMTLGAVGSHILGLILHYTWLVTLIGTRSGKEPLTSAGTAVGPWFAGLVCILTAGILHVQLLLNHASRPMTHESDANRALPRVDWVKLQADATADLDNSPLFDWFHGGLNYQIVHHLFPRMRPDRFRAAAPDVYAMLRRHDIEVFINKGIIGGVVAVTNQLATACHDSGYEPWPPAKWTRNLPITFWSGAHLFLFGLLPLVWRWDSEFTRCFCSFFCSFWAFAIIPLARPGTKRPDAKVSQHPFNPFVLG